MSGVIEPSPEMSRAIDAMRGLTADVPLDLEERRRIVDKVLAKRAVGPEVNVEPVEAACAGEFVWSGTPTGEGAEGTIMYLHGGGFVSGSPLACRPFANTISSRVGCRFLALDYRLAPENPFPAAIDDVVEMYRWLLQQGCEAEKIVVAGDSAGGGLAVASLLAARDRHLPMPSGGLLISPFLDLTLTSSSMRAEPSADPMGTLEHWRADVDRYLGGHDPTDGLASPVLADVTGLPALHIEVGTAERLLDDSRAFKNNCDQFQVPCELVETPGAIHCFPLQVPEAPESQAAIRRIALWLKARLTEPTETGR